MSWSPSYSRWRHGGWYVDNVRYPSGAVGCVSRNYPDGKWRVVCDERPGDRAYPSRDAAAWAERDLASAACAAAPKCERCGFAYEGECRRYACLTEREA